MIDFRHSTHSENWLFTKAQLAQLLKDKDASQIRQIAQSMTPDMISKVTVGDTVEKKAAQFLIKPDLEEKIVADFCERIKKEFAQFTSNVLCIAMAFLQRFFLFESVFCHSPENIAYACLYLAAKLEEMNYTANHFCQALKLDPAQVNLVAHEQILMEGLKFDLHIHTPLASIDALIKLLSL